MNKYFFIDAKHLLHRCAYSQQELTYNNQPVGALYGFLRSIVKCKRDFPLHHFVVAWDGGHNRRDILSAEGVANGIVPEKYKENRTRCTDDQSALVRWQINQQMKDVYRATDLIRVQEAFVEGYEADDIIGSYILASQDPAVILTSDKDYYQILGEGVVLLDPIKATRFTMDDFYAQYGIWPEQWVDVGALAGDKGDNIFGVPGVGEITAVKLIKTYGTIEAVFAGLKQKKASGAKLLKTDEAVLAHEARVNLAYQLKLMDSKVPNLPLLAPVPEKDPNQILAFLKEFGFESLFDQVDALVT